MPEEDAIFGRSLKCMSALYASVTGTSVLQEKYIPPCPPDLQGRVTLRLKEAPPEAEVDTAALRASIASMKGHFEVESLVIDQPGESWLKAIQRRVGTSLQSPRRAESGPACVNLRLATHEQAERFVLEWGEGAFLVFNGREYDGRGGRGW